MEDNVNLDVEQPQVNVDSLSNPGTGEKTLVEDCGSTFGKFKDATSLLSAYNELQAEFTRKSQKLSEVLKKLETTSDNKNIDGLAQEIDKGSTDEINLVNSTENKPQNVRSNWTNVVDDFFSRNPDAKSDAKSIATILKANPELRNLKNGIDIAYKMVQAENYRKPADLSHDPEFVRDHIMTNDEIKSSIIREYLENASKAKTMPKMLGKEIGEHVYASANPIRPNSIENAGRIFEEMLKGKK